MARTVDNAKKQLRAWLQRPAPRQVMSIVMSMVFGVALAFVLPERFTEDILTDKFARLAAPVMSARYPLAHRDEITVVLIDQKSLEGHEWPASYSYYSKLLKEIAVRKPKAIFLDVVLVHENDNTFESLKKTIADLSERTKDHPPIKIFLAAIRYGTNLRISDDVDQMKEATKVAVEYEPSGVDHLAWSYPLIYRTPRPTTEKTQGAIKRAAASVDATAEQSATDAEGTRAIPESVRSAAFAIYMDPDLGLRPKRGEAHDEKLPSSVALNWGLAPSRMGPTGWTYNPTQEEENEHQEERQEDHDRIRMVLHRAAYWAGLAKTRGTRESPDKRDGNDIRPYCSSKGETNPALLLWRTEVRAVFPSVGLPMCAFHRTVIAGEMNEMEGSDQMDAFTNRIVMIGTALDDGGDFIFSPLHDRLPGVYLHAMALDNLMTWRGNYVESREPALGWSDGKWRLQLVALIGMLGVVFLYILQEACERGFKDRIEGKTHHTPTHRRRWRTKPGAAVVVTKTALRHARSHAMTQERLHGGRAMPRHHESKPPSVWRRIVAAVFWKLVTFCAGIVLTLGLLLFGQELLHESYLGVTHVVACAMTAEWFHWGKKFVAFFTGHEESES